MRSAASSRALLNPQSLFWQLGCFERSRPSRQHEAYAKQESVGLAHTVPVLHYGWQTGHILLPPHCPSGCTRALPQPSDPSGHMRGATCRQTPGADLTVCHVHTCRPGVVFPLARLFARSGAALLLGHPRPIRDKGLRKA